MLGNRSSGTKPEERFFALLAARGLEPVRNMRLPLEGVRRTCDFGFPDHRVAVFLDGELWHPGPDWRLPRTNTGYWLAKAVGNLERDWDTEDRLAAIGWSWLRLREGDDLIEGVLSVESMLAGRATEAAGSPGGMW